jgi:tRNA A-37 threonylcarbamoyl transferase component Bud32
MEPGSTIGRYRVARFLAKGAMGEVWAADDQVIGRPVAIKLVKRELIEGGDAAAWLRRFAHEVRAAGLLHANIVTVLDVGEAAGAPYLVMEFVEGESLDRVLKQSGRLVVADAVAIAVQVLAALDFAHSRGVIHRDVKPSNILQTRDGAIKLTDFGIAHIEGSDLTFTGQFLGTPSYMSPEALAALRVDQRSDIFSAAVVLFELLSGSKPFQGLERRGPADLGSLNAAVPPALRQVIAKAMAFAPGDRYQSAAEFARAIAEACAKRVAEPLPLRGDTTLVAAPPAQPGGADSRNGQAERRPEPPRRPASRRWRAPAIATAAVVAAAVVAAAISAGYAVWPGPAPAPTPPGPPVAVAPPPAAPATPPVDREAMFWSSIKDSSNPADLEAYLKQFPSGNFAPLARNRLATLRPPAAPAAPRTTPGQVWELSGVEASAPLSSNSPYGKFVPNIGWRYVKGNQSYVIKTFSGKKITTSSETRMYIIAQGEMEGFGCHACNGLLGFFMFDEHNTLLASLPTLEAGSWGSTANITFDLKQFGADNLYGWLLRSGYAAQGASQSFYFIFLPKGRTFEMAAILPHEDNNLQSMECDGQHNLGQCHDLHYDLTIGVSDGSEKIFPLMLERSGTMAGKRLQPEKYRIRFDTNRWRYVIPAKLAETVKDVTGP